MIFYFFHKITLAYILNLILQVSTLSHCDWTVRLIDRPSGARFFDLLYSLAKFTEFTEAVIENTDGIS